MGLREKYVTLFGIHRTEEWEIVSLVITVYSNDLGGRKDFRHGYENIRLIIHQENSLSFQNLIVHSILPSSPSAETQRDFDDRCGLSRDPHRGAGSVPVV